MSSDITDKPRKTKKLVRAKTRAKSSSNHAPREPAPNILQLRVTLNGLEPLIWRQIQVLSDSTFLDLHMAIRDVMGWDDSHLHEFAFEAKKPKRQNRPVHIGTSGEDIGQNSLDEDETLIRDWLGRGKHSMRCIYTYDFGDSWEHIVLLEKVLPASPDVHYPRCIAGQRASPPEDCGGIWGYADILESLENSKESPKENPKHEQYADLLEWVDKDFDPEAFDPEAVIFRTSFRGM